MEYPNLHGETLIIVEGAFINGLGWPAMVASRHDTTAQESVDYAQLATRFFSRWAVSFDETCAAFESLLAPACRWEQRPLMVTNTRVGALRFLRLSHQLLGLETIDVELPHLVATGNVVLCERIDHLRRRDGSLIASARVAGILEFDGDHLVAWREHFDAVGFALQMPRNALIRRAR
ncbi:hypothetical protein DSM112329_03641 [Paraconexibacter sp. AEG42_29]|uniref:Limonene-1,2-epoxide hydrolase domain-containing protein n=1 Tax=Paraconexibacter sp. AEG42_29 TaxID=2997339 RepID=A0AAU7AYP0_9ACTN